MQNGGKKQIGIIRQISILFLAGLLLVAALTAIIQHRSSQKAVKAQLLMLGEQSAGDVINYIESYPAHDWLLNYWCDHYDEIDADYAAEYDPLSPAAEKVRLLAERHPDFVPDYATTEEIESLPAEDQHIYAEIIYSWLISHIDIAAVNYDLDYFYCFISDEPYDEQTVLFIASKDDRERGEGPGMIYPIGKVLNTSNGQRNAMAKAAAGEPQLAYNEASTYVDYYCPMGTAGGHRLFIGVTREVTWINEAVRANTLSTTALSVSLLAAMAAVCLLMIYLAMVRPLRKVQNSLRVYKENKDSSAIFDELSGLISYNEIGMLSNDVIDLSKELDTYTKKIEKAAAEKERLSSELDTAARIQAAMLPDEFPAFPGRNEFDIYASMEPAKEVGGDFYDFFLIDDDHLCMAIADVSGKGIPASLFMMASKIILKNNAMNGRTAAEILELANEAICANNKAQMFVTVWLGILEISTGRITAANAGHEYPVIKSGGSFEILKDRHGFVVGGMEGMQYKEYEIQLKPGSQLFLYTDGLPEAEDSNENMFGMDRVLESLNGCSDDTAEDILRKMKDAVSGFVGEAEQFDDLTMMCVTYKGPAK